MKLFKLATSRFGPAIVILICRLLPLRWAYRFGELLIFFGREARLPVGHARLALDTGAQMVVGVSHCTGDGQYRAEMAVAPRPASTGSKRQDSICWAQVAFATIESYLWRWPGQWLMPSLGSGETRRWVIRIER